jgi:hypothetical protein
MNRQLIRAWVFIGCVLCGCHAGAQTAQAQEATAGLQTPARRERTDVNYEVKLYLLVASDDAAGSNRLPPELQPVINQLRASLPFRNYALGITFINRVRDGGNLEVKGVANSLLSAMGGSSPATFYDFTLARVNADADAQGREIVQVQTLRFGMRVPIQTATVPGSDGKSGYPVINYEPLGLTTTVSFREGTPVVIGTLTTNRTDQIMVLAAQIKRADTR